jgi:hypothetical protein
LCTYKGGRFIEAQLQSILAQTRSVDSIVVSDDGSPDDTVAKVTQCLHGAPMATQVLKVGRLGITQNFARAVSTSDADVIFLCDQDDWWQPEKVERVMAVFETDPAALLVFSDARLVDANLQDLGRSQFQAVRLSTRQLSQLTGPGSFETLLRRNVVTGATVAFRRSLLKVALPFVDGWLHDEWLAILAAAQSGLRGVAEPLVLYRQHDANQCGMRQEALAVQLSAAAAVARYSSSTRLFALGKRIEERLPEGEQRQRLAARIVQAERFERARQTLPVQRVARLPWVLAGLLLGHYHRQADGMRSAVKDVLANAKR